MVLALSLIALIVVLVAFWMSGRAGILAAIGAMPFIALGWDTAIVGAINPPRLAGVLIPAMVLLRMGVDRKRIHRQPMFALWTTYVVFIALTSIQEIGRHGLMNYVNLASRPVHGLIGFFMIAAYFNTREQFRKLLIAFLIAGIFPVLVVLYQVQTGTYFGHMNVATGDLYRMHGFYHNMQTQRIFVLEVIAAALLYGAYYIKGPGLAMRSLLFGYVAAGLVNLYVGYSKAAVAIIVVWAAIWTVARRSLIPVLILAVGVGIANSVLENRLSQEIDVIFAKEVRTVETKGQSQEALDYTFAGRVGVWRDYFAMFSQKPAIQQVFGMGTPLAAHNDFMAMLLTGGYVGLAIYLALLLVNGARITRNYFRQRNPLNIMAVMMYAMWLIDSIGLTPSAYPFYQWFVWGLIGLSYRGVEGLTPATTGRTQAARSGFRNGIPPRPETRRHA